MVFPVDDDRGLFLEDQHTKDPEDQNDPPKLEGVPTAGAPHTVFGSTRISILELVPSTSSEGGSSTPRTIKARELSRIKNAYLYRKDRQDDQQLRVSNERAA